MLRTDGPILNVKKFTKPRQKLYSRITLIKSRNLLVYKQLLALAWMKVNMYGKILQTIYAIPNFKENAEIGFVGGL